VTKWIRRELRGDVAAYLEIADALSDAIASGVLPPGARLPAIRALAKELGVAPATVLRAYREARQRGLIGGTVGRGTFVLAQSDDRDPALEVFAARGFYTPGVYDLRANAVPAPAEWSESGGLSALLPSAREQRSIISAAYMLRGSFEPRELREAGAHWARLCGTDIHSREIMLAAGGQHAISAALCAFGAQGLVLALPEMTNSGALTAARALGARLVPIKTRGGSLDLSHLAHVARTQRPKALYCAPSAGNPIPWVMTHEERVGIAEIASRFDLWIIEDDAIGPLVDRTVPPLAHLAPDRTLWLASVAQPLGFGFRLAFVRVPAKITSSMQTALHTLAWTGATPGALLAARALSDGRAAHVIEGRKQAIAQRHALLGKVIGSGRCTCHPGIPYVWFHTPPGWRTDSLHEALLATGVLVGAGAQFAANPRHVNRGVRISGGGFLSLSEYEDALRRIADCCAHPRRYRQAAPQDQRTVVDRRR
jgi:DNA-binding transcriptional MocR family regulator